ncbi:MAG: hypothetical protein ABSH09_01225 [Bryobacteraceae bacterium]|jgi:hypothetical protein
MLGKHIDAIALVVIALGLLVFSRASELRQLRAAQNSQIRIHNALNQTDACPLTEMLIPHFR